MLCGIWRILGTIGLCMVALLATDRPSLACECDPNKCPNSCVEVVLKTATLKTLQKRDRETLKSQRAFIMTMPSGEKFRVTPMQAKP